MFPCVKEEPAEDAGVVPEPNTSVLTLSRKRKIRGFQEEGRRDPIGLDSRLAKRPLRVDQARREEGEDEIPASTRRVPTEGPSEPLERIDNLRLRIHEMTMKLRGCHN